MYYDVTITQNMLILSVNWYFFSNKNVNSTAVFCSSFFFECKMCGVSQTKNVTDGLSFQLHVDIDKKYILLHFPLLETMIIESTCFKM